MTPSTWKVRYATSVVSGSVINNTISMAGIDLKLSFRLVSKVLDDFLTYPMDRILVSSL